MDIEWSPKAHRQLKGIIYYYIEEEAFQAAKRLQKEIDSVLTLLKNSPYIGKRELEEAKGMMRRSIVLKKHYKIIYTISFDKIFITAFWDVRQDPDRLQDYL